MRGEQILRGDANQWMSAVARGGELSPAVAVTTQFLVAADEIQIRREPRHGQIMKQTVDEGGRPLEVGVERVAGGDLRAVAAREEAEDHALDGDAAIVERTLLLVGAWRRRQPALEGRLAIAELDQSFLDGRRQVGRTIRGEHRPAEQQRAGDGCSGF